MNCFRTRNNCGFLHDWLRKIGLFAVFHIYCLRYDDGFVFDVSLRYLQFYLLVHCFYMLIVSVFQREIEK